MREEIQNTRETYWLERLPQYRRHVLAASIATFAIRLFVGHHHWLPLWIVTVPVSIVIWFAVGRRLYDFAPALEARIAPKDAERWRQRLYASLVVLQYACGAAYLAMVVFAALHDQRS